jgi:hypothetical protein
MWKCSHCSKEVDAELDTCWNCGYSKEGHPPSNEVRNLLAEAKKEQKIEREFEKTNRVKLQATSKSEVTIVDVQIPFWSMVVLLVKWVLASIPALFILAILTMIGGAIFGGIFHR